MVFIENSKAQREEAWCTGLSALKLLWSQPWATCLKSKSVVCDFIVKAVKGFHNPWHSEDPSLTLQRWGKSRRSSCLFKCLQDETTAGTLSSGRVTSENSLIHNSEKGVRRELPELQRYSQGPLGVSINLHIYLKLSKFTMTNVTAPLNWSSSLGSLGGLGAVPATGTWKEINLQIPWKHRELLWETYGGSHTSGKKKASKCQRRSSDGRRVSTVHT